MTTNDNLCRATRKRQERARLRWVQRHANALAAEHGGKLDVDELDRRLRADMDAHPELFAFLGTWMMEEGD